MTTTVLEVQRFTPQPDTLSIRLQPPKSSSIGKGKKGKIKLDPLRALEPARKKLTSVEAQRVMAVLEDTIRKIEVSTMLPYIINNLDRFSVMLGADLVQMLQSHKVIIDSHMQLKENAERLILKKQRKATKTPESRPGSGSSVKSMSSISSIDDKIDSSLTSLSLVEKQLQFSVKNVLRAFTINPSVYTSIQKELESERSKESRILKSYLKELREILMEKLLTTPVEEKEKQDYLVQVTQQERQHSAQIDQLQTELSAAMDDKDSDIKKKNDVIRRLQAELHQIGKFSEEHIKRTKSEADKQEAADKKNSEGKQVKLNQELSTLKVQLQNLITEHRESEQNLRLKKYKLETEVENWIQRYDNDMGDRQDRYEEMDARYTEEKKQLHELEERFKTLETEYTQIQEERRIAREKREAAERELQLMVKGATTIQAFWRSYKVRKALNAKKKGKGKKGKKGKK